jgi:branched-subunit amino acid transport protein AzlD
MTPKTIKSLVFIALLVHGIGHFQGVIGSLGVKFNERSSSVSWLLRGLGQKTNRIICLTMYLVTGVLGILTALCLKDLILTSASWQDLALITAILSTLCLIIFPRALAMFFNKAGAIAVNLVIYYSILLNGHWPSVLFED